MRPSLKPQLLSSKVGISGGWEYVNKRALERGLTLEPHYIKGLSLYDIESLDDGKANRHGTINSPASDERVFKAIPKGRAVLSPSGYEVRGRVSGVGGV